MDSFSFGSVSGSTFAFYFFLLIALFIGFAVCRLLVEPRLNKRIQQSIPIPLALMIGGSVALMVFLGIYFTSLDGFYRLDIDKNDQSVRLSYILPRHALTLNRNEIAEISRVPSYKGRWQLVLYTPAGARFTSARADYASTRKAWEYLNTQFDHELKPER